MPSIPLSQITPWEKNKLLRGIRHEGYDRLKRNLELGQHTTLLLYPVGENQYISLGGNNRLVAMEEMNYAEAEAIILTFEQDDKGYYGLLNGKVYKNKNGEIDRYFKTIEQGMIEFAFSHNMRGAFYLEDEVANMVGNFPDIDWSSYDAEFNDPVDLTQIDKLTKDFPRNENEKGQDIKCPNCGHEFKKE